MAEWNYADWAEKAASENLKHRLATGDVLLAQANTLLTLLMAGIGGSLAYALKIFEPGTAIPAAYGALAACLYLVAVALVVMFECIATRNTDVPGNEPDNMYHPQEGHTELQVRNFSLESMQRRITSTKLRNRAVAWWLDRCRYAALATPFIFVSATMAAR